MFDESDPQRKDTATLSTVQVLKLGGESREMDVGRQPTWTTTRDNPGGLEVSVKGLRSKNWPLQNSHGAMQYSIGNVVNNLH